MKIERLYEPLSVGDIDFKVAQVTKTDKAVWANILAYKDARVDMRILDEAVGPTNWQVEYQRDTKGVLQCTVSIWDEEKQQWISKCSNGVESDYESEKGEYSDAFKRACFMWGIGRQLYDFPAVWVQLNDKDYYEKDGKVKASNRLRPNEWEWNVSEDYQIIQVKRKYANSWKVIFDNNPYKKRDE